MPFMPGTNTFGVAIIGAGPTGIAAGHAPFLFPGNFKEYRGLHDENGLYEYELD
jgi:hypothetical protein